MNTEKPDLEFLASIRWKDRFRCPLCGHTKYWALTNGNRKCRKMGHHVSPTTGTLLGGSKFSVHIISKAINNILEKDPTKKLNAKNFLAENKDEIGSNRSVARLHSVLMEAISLIRLPNGIEKIGFDLKAPPLNIESNKQLLIIHCFSSNSAAVALRFILVEPSMASVKIKSFIEAVEKVNLKYKKRNETKTLLMFSESIRSLKISAIGNPVSYKDSRHNEALSATISSMSNELRIVYGNKLKKKKFEEFLYKFSFNQQLENRSTKIDLVWHELLKTRNNLKTE